MHIVLIKRSVLFIIFCLALTLTISAQQRRPIDAQHPLWLVHVDVWNKADPQKIIDLIPDKVKPYVCMNLSLSCQYDKEKNVYKMPQNAVRTYKSWASVCQQNGLWFTCQPASGGHTHIQDNDLETFEYFFKRYPNFLGWNYAEQFWGFDEAGDRSSSTQTSRIALFAKLVEMSHQYGGFLTISFCGNIWSHLLNPVGMMKRDRNLLNACRQYPEAILWLYKYTTSSCFYNNESVTFSPFISGLAKNYGVRYDNCGWNGALDALLGKDHGKKYPIAAGIGTVMEQTAVNGGAVWDGPELIWTEDFKETDKTTVSNFTRRNWTTYPGFNKAWLDMFEKIIDGALYIPTREEVVGKTKIVVINNVTSGNDEDKYAAWGDLYDNLYKQDDPFNRGNGQWMDNFCYFKKTGRYGAIPVAIELYDDLAKAIPVQVKKTARSSRWSTLARKVKDFNDQYPEVSTGDLYVNRYRNQLVTYTPYTYLNKKTTASAKIPCQYNTCDSLYLTYGKLSSGLVREYADHIDFYLNNFRTDTTTQVVDQLIIKGATTEPSFKLTKRLGTPATATAHWDVENALYTLSVKHMGPVDVTINCSGAGEERLTDFLPNAALELPKQPEPFFGEIIIEAEDMDYKSIKSCVLDPYNWYPYVRGHAGNGFMDMGTNTAGALRHQLKLQQGGDYEIAIRYSNTSKAATLNVNVNGTRSNITIDKVPMNEWRKAVVSATLKEGSNTLTITNNKGINMYIDQISYMPAGVEVEKFAITIRDTEHGSATADVVEAAEGTVVHLTAEPEAGYALTGWVVEHGNITIADDDTFTMPDDNVTIAPIFVDMTAVYILDYTNVLGGAIPEGWRVVQGDNDIHEYPNTYGAGGGSRVMTGFTGYQGKGLYWRVVSAEYGRQSAYKLHLMPGSYKLTFACAAWKGTPKYRARILGAADAIIAQSPVYSATPNVNGNTAANITSAKTYELPFEITTEGDYVISFVNNGTGFDEFLLLECRVNSVLIDGIFAERINDGQQAIDNGTIFNTLGLRQPSLRRGLNIVVTPDGKARKILVK